jgi:hypothetical protein
MNLNIKWSVYLILALLVASCTGVVAQAKKKTVTKKTTNKPASSTKKTETEVLSTSVSKTPDTTAKPVTTTPPEKDRPLLNLGNTARAYRQSSSWSELTFLPDHRISFASPLNNNGAVHSTT